MDKIALNIYELKKGDILLTSMTDDLSIAIQKMTGSKFTHASLYLGDASFIEATLDGANYFSPLYFLFENLDSIKVLRLDYSLYEDIDEILEGVEFAARDFSFRQYAQTTAIKAGKLKEAEQLGNSKIETVSILDDWEKSVHCSQLVALAYNIGGKINLIDNKKPENITPADLENSEFLIDVTFDVTFEIDDTQKELEAKLYPESPESSILIKQTTVSQLALKGIAKTFAELELALPPDLALVIQLLLKLEQSKAKKLDEALDRVLSELEYYSLGEIYKKDYTENNNETPERIKERIVSGEINSENYQSNLEFLDFSIMLTENTIRKQKWNLYANLNNYEHTKFQTHKSLRDMYIDFLDFLTVIYAEKLNAFQYIINEFEEK